MRTKGDIGKTLLPAALAFAAQSCAPTLPDHALPPAAQPARQTVLVEPDQTPPPSAATIPLAQPAPEPAAVTRQNPRLCDGFLPAGFAVPRNTADSLLSYRLDENGALRDVALFRSSGTDALDRAALACGSASRTMPLLVDAKPVEVDLIGSVTWQSPSHAIEAFAEAGIPGICNSTGHPAARALNKERHPTAISYLIGPDGGVTEVTITSSSGNAALDSAAVECVSTFRYFPATMNSRPVKIKRTMTVRWGLR